MHKYADTHSATTWFLHNLITLDKQDLLQKYRVFTIRSEIRRLQSSLMTSAVFLSKRSYNTKQRHNLKKGRIYIFGKCANNYSSAALNNRHLVHTPLKFSNRKRNNQQNLSTKLLWLLCYIYSDFYSTQHFQKANHLMLI